MTENILYTEDLSIGYQQKKHALVVASGIKLSLKAGKLVSLVGANGIGKSTLLRTLTGIQPSLSGCVFLAQKPLHSYNPLSLAKALSVVLTEKLPPSNLTVFELIATGRQPYTNWIGKLDPEDITKINEAMQLAGVSAFAAKKFYELSDGQLQNVLVARAFAQDTPLIVLDEPMTHLDFQHKAALFRLLKKLASETNKSILFSTHDIEMAIQVSDEMLVMTQGKIEQGQPQTFITNGTFNTLFADNQITFDIQKGKFVFKEV